MVSWHIRGMETIRLDDAVGTFAACHVWSKGDAMGNATGPFITYWEELFGSGVASKRLSYMQFLALPGPILAYFC